MLGPGNKTGFSATSGTTPEPNHAHSPDSVSGPLMMDEPSESDPQSTGCMVVGGHESVGSADSHLKAYPTSTNPT